MTETSREFAMNTLAVMVIEELAEREHKTPDEVFLEFVKSRTYAELYDPECGLWMNGPDYITDEYELEKQNI